MYVYICICMYVFIFCMCLFGWWLSDLPFIMTLHFLKSLLIVYPNIGGLSQVFISECMSLFES